MAQATHHVWCRPRSYLQAVGGCVVDSGKFDWMKRDPTGTRFPSMTAPEPAYHGLVFAEQFGDLAFTIFGHAVGLRDLGCTMAPQNAFYSLLGVETLSLRMERHCANALALAEYVSFFDVYLSLRVRVCAHEELFVRCADVHARASHVRSCFPW
jgi:O-acetylhomoserine/O-acetylserine sulfhydrylase-like pyridoxal-dependent enzyme